MEQEQKTDLIPYSGIHPGPRPCWIFDHLHLVEENDGPHSMTPRDAGVFPGGMGMDHWDHAACVQRRTRWARRKVRSEWRSFKERETKKPLISSFFLVQSGGPVLLPGCMAMDRARRRRRRARRGTRSECTNLKKTKQKYRSPFPFFFIVSPGRGER